MPLTFSSGIQHAYEFSSIISKPLDVRVQNMFKKFVLNHIIKFDFNLIMKFQIDSLRNVSKLYLFLIRLLGP